MCGKREGIHTLILFPRLQAVTFQCELPSGSTHPCVFVLEDEESPAMKTPYTFSILRYIHDVVSGEFVNVGVVLYVREVQFLGIACVMIYGRISSALAELRASILRE
jgi:hypothetical protein